MAAYSANQTLGSKLVPRGATAQIMGNLKKSSSESMRHIAFIFSI